MDGPRLDYTLAGEAGSPALVLLHAGGMTRREWEPFLPGWAGHFRIVAPSALGHGASPRAAELTLPALVDATLAFLDALGIDRAHFVGSSMGGATALRIALQHPDRVDRIVLYRSGHRVHSGVRKALERVATPENWRQWGLERWMSREHEPQGGPEAWMDVIRRVAAAFDTSKPGVSIGLHELAQMERPCLLVTGDRDSLVPIDDVIEAWRALPDADLWVVPGAGHILGMETWRKEAFVAEVRRFLQAPRRPEPAARTDA